MYDRNEYLFGEKLSRLIEHVLVLGDIQKIERKEKSTK